MTIINLLHFDYVVYEFPSLSHLISHEDKMTDIWNDRDLLDYFDILSIGNYEIEKTNMKFENLQNSIILKNKNKKDLVFEMIFEIVKELHELNPNITHEFNNISFINDNGIYTLHITISTS